VRGTGDLGVVIERAAGRVQVVEHSHDSSLGTVEGLGDLSHAHVTFSRDARYAYVFGRDGGLTKVDLLARRIDKRIIQAGNSIGGSISQDGRLIVAQNYEPGGIKAFDADTLELLADVPAEYAPGKFSRSSAWPTCPASASCMPSSRPARSASPTSPIREARHHPLPGRQAALRRPRHPDGRYFLAGLFGEDGISLLDLWQPEAGAQDPRRLRPRRRKAAGLQDAPPARLVAGRRAGLAARHRPPRGARRRRRSWQETGRVPVKGQPVFVMARPDGRQVWVNFAFPDNEWVQVIDTVEKRVVHTFSPGKAVLHMEFTPGEEVWLSPGTATGSAWWTPPPSPCAASSRRRALGHLLHLPRPAHRLLR
jgi:protein NirF